MSWIKTYTKSSIGKKQLMAVSGLAWAGFVFGHFVGNTPLLLGESAAPAFNKYANFLTSLGGALYAVEAILMVLLLSHMVLAIKTRMENKKARPIGYLVNAKRGDRGIASFTMPYTGLIILIFLIVHIATFKYGPYYETTYDGVVMRDLYKTVAEWYGQWYYALFYLVSMIALGLHLGHGFGSALQTFGLNHPRYNALINKASIGYALLIGGGNAIITIVMFVRGGL